MRGPGEHGGLRDAELRVLGLRVDDVLDFSVNVNPYGPCDEVLVAVRAASLSRYPDPTGQAAREALAASLDVAPARVVLGPGAAELLWGLARLLVPGGRSAVVVEPAFSEFRAAVRASGGRVVTWRAHAEDAFAVDLAAVDRVLAAERPAALYAAAPANPTGAALPAPALAALATAHPGVTIVLDEAFLSLSERAADAAVPLPPNVVRVRSLTKDHALAGLRVAYLVAHEVLAGALEASRPPWATSTLAQAAAAAAVRAGRFIDESRRRLLADREHLAATLRRAGHAPLPSTTSYLLLPVPDGADLRRRLLARHHVLVRDCASFGLPGHVRLAARPPADVERLVPALAAELPARRPR